MPWTKLIRFIAKEDGKVSSPILLSSSAVFSTFGRLVLNLHFSSRNITETVLLEEI
jgi:hypothetical protein